tara:strand:- start:35 stop:157 length:123 start_codon:yes stop_codon:yes gene_type:complete
MATLSDLELVAGDHEKNKKIKNILELLDTPSPQFPGDPVK